MASSLRVSNERVYVAVGSDVEESKSTLSWALNTFGGNFRILHVHQPNQNTSNTRQHGNNGVLQVTERDNMHRILDAYIHICNQAEVHAEKRYLEMKDVGKGIVELIEQHAIERLVMGAAANMHYSEGMSILKSTKAVFVNQHAHPSCQIWFVCGGHLIQIRDGDLNMVDMDAATLQHSSANSVESNLRSSNAGEVNDDLPIVMYERGEPSGSSSSPSYDEGQSNDEIYGRLERAMAEAFQELLKRQNASERAAAEAMDKANFVSRSLAKESKRRQELEEVLARKTEQFEVRNKQQEQELLVAQESEGFLQSRIAGFETVVRQLKEKLANSEEQLRICCQKLKDMEAEIRRTGEASSSRSEQCCLSEFSFVDIQRATDNFNPSMIIEEHGSIYRGILRHTNVAIKVFRSDSHRGLLRFNQELDVMSKLRHPNIVTLIGVCREPCALIYEHLSNGNLEDRLACNDETAPLPWLTRIGIAAKVCAALVFLHSNRPHCFVHGNLKPKNVLLDGNFTAKLSDFGTFGHRPDPEVATSPHLDPHFLSSGELSDKSDVYSFGIMLLQLLTGRSAVNLARYMRDAVNGQNTSYLTTLLDPLAGDWPLPVATELARLALKCCDTEQNTRPDLRLEVWSILEPIRANYEAMSESEEAEQPPEHFMCPILHEVMQDPVVAADGFTYEGDALRRWFDSGHQTSPMTGADLSNSVLIPNRTLRSGIQQWLQDH